MRYMNYASAEVEVIASTHRPPDLYLVPDVATSFVQDGTRDGEHIRKWMHEVFISELTVQKLPFHLLYDSLEERLKVAIKRIDEILNNSIAARSND